jgi:hypothetical protein
MKQFCVGKANIMARGRGETGQAAVLDSGQIKRLLKIAGTTVSVRSGRVLSVFGLPDPRHGLVG